MNKELPKELEIEKSVLSLILVYPDERQEAFRLLTADDFYLEAHRLIFQKCNELHRKGVAAHINKTERLA
jgi:replicative DNA helicase